MLKLWYTTDPTNSKRQSGKTSRVIKAIRSKPAGQVFVFADTVSNLEAIRAKLPYEYRRYVTHKCNMAHALRGMRPDHIIFDFDSGIPQINPHTMGFMNISTMDGIRLLTDTLD